MILATSAAFASLTPAINSSWIDIAWWVIPFIYAALNGWAIVELIRNRSLDITPKIAFAFLVALAPFVGSILTILLVRAHARPSGREQTARASRAQVEPRSTPR